MLGCSGGNVGRAVDSGVNPGTSTSRLVDCRQGRLWYNSYRFTSRTTDLMLAKD